MNDLYNPSHCADPTAKAAMDNVDDWRKKEAQKERAKDLMGCLIRMCSLAGYDVTSTIEIRHRKSGLVYTSRKRK